MEGRARSGGSFRPDSAPMAGDDPLDGGKADARSLELGAGVKALEDAEELVDLGHVEAHSVVPHEIAPLPVPLFAPELYSGRRLLAGELPGVLEEILDRDLQQPGIAASSQALPDSKI